MEALDVDEVIAQLLVTEGFATDRGSRLRRSLAKSPTSKASTKRRPSEIQSRAREYLEQQEAERDAKRRELGVADELAEDSGHDHRDDGRARRERHQDGRGSSPTAPPTNWSGGPSARRKRTPRPVRHKGFLDGFELSRNDVEDMIMAARVQAGWISADDHLLPAEPEVEAVEEDAEDVAEGVAPASDA